MCVFIGWCDLSQDAQAAWAQGILSIVGVALAIWLPIRIANQERRRRYLGVEGLFIALHGRVDTLYQRARDGHVEFGHAVNDQDLARLIEAMDRIPAHDLPDAGLILPLIDAISAANRFKATYAELTGYGQVGTQFTQEKIETLKILRKGILELYLLVHRMGAYRFGSAFYRWRDRRRRRAENRGNAR